MKNNLNNETTDRPAAEEGAPGCCWVQDCHHRDFAFKLVLLSMRWLYFKVTPLERGLLMARQA